MDEAQAVNLLIQAVHKGQAKGAFELMESYTLAAAVDTASKLQEKLQKEAQEKAKEQLLAEAQPNGAEKAGHEQPGAPELLKEIGGEDESDKKKK